MRLGNSQVRSQLRDSYLRIEEELEAFASGETALAVLCRYSLRTAPKQSRLAPLFET